MTRYCPPDFYSPVRAQIQREFYMYTGLKKNRFKKYWLSITWF